MKRTPGSTGSTRHCHTAVTLQQDATRLQKGCLFLARSEAVGSQVEGVVFLMLMVGALDKRHATLEGIVSHTDRKSVV